MGIVPILIGGWRSPNFVRRSNQRYSFITRKNHEVTGTRNIFYYTNGIVEKLIEIFSVFQKTDFCIFLYMGAISKSEPIFFKFSRAYIRPSKLPCVKFHNDPLKNAAPIELRWQIGRNIYMGAISKSDPIFSKLNSVRLFVEK